MSLSSLASFLLLISSSILSKAIDTSMMDPGKTKKYINTKITIQNASIVYLFECLVRRYLLTDNLVLKLTNRLNSAATAVLFGRASWSIRVSKVAFRAALKKDFCLIALIFVSLDAFRKSRLHFSLSNLFKSPVRLWYCSISSLISSFFNVLFSSIVIGFWFFDAVSLRIPCC